MSTICPNCSANVGDDSKFCSQCGFPLTEGENLYHYTSLDTLKKILQNVHCSSKGENEFILFATKWDSLNDPLENRYFIDNLHQYIEDNLDLHKLSNTIDDLIKLESSFVGAPYIISLSKQRNDLVMWRNYATNGTGVAIGLNAKKLKDYIVAFRDYYLRVLFYNCRYLTKNEFYNYCDTFLKSYLQEIDQLNTNVSCNLEWLIRSFTMLKHPCYMSEKEWRIVLFDNEMKQWPALIKYPTKGQDNRPYKEFNIPLSTIEEIVIGPCAESNSEKIIHDLLTSYPDANIQIAKSDLPYKII